MPRPLLLSLLVTFPLGAQLLIDTYAGGAIPSGIPANNAVVGAISGLTWDSSGNIVFSDTTFNVIRRVHINGIIETIAGTGVTGFGGDGGPATAALLRSPESPQYDGSGNLYFFDGGNARIRRIDVNGIITTIVGDGERAGPESEGPATARSVPSQFFAVDPGGIVYLSDNGGNLLRVTPAGNLEFFVQIPLIDPSGLVTDAQGNVYFLDQYDYYEPQTLYRVSPSGVISTFATYAQTGSTGGFLASDQAGHIYTFFNNQLRRYATDGTFTVLKAPSALTLPAAIDPNGNIAFGGMWVIQMFTAQSVLTPIAGGNPQPAPDGTPLRDAWFVRPVSIAFSGSGDLYIVELSACLIRKISAAGVLSTFAGNGACSTSLPSGNAKTISLPYPNAIAVDSQNRVWVSDSFDSNVYSIAQNGTVSTPIGRTSGGCLDGAVAIDSADRIYVLSCSLSRIRTDGSVQQIFQPPSGQYSALGTDPSGNVYAGTWNEGTFRINDAGLPSMVPNACSTRNSIAVDAQGNFWQNPNFTLDICGVSGVAVLGSPFNGSSGDGGPAVGAGFNDASSLTFSPSGQLYFLDSYRIRRITGTAPSTPPVVSQGGIVNAVSYAGGSVAPGELVSIFGTNFGASSVQVNSAVNNAIPLSIGRTGVLFNGQLGAITAVTPTQINVFVPYGVTTPVTVQVQVDNILSAPVTVPVTATAVGFSASILNQDGTLNTAANPAPRGSVVSFFGTGLGAMMPQLNDGNLAISTPYSTPVNSPTVTIGGQSAVLLYAGDAPGFPTGVFQINATIPAGIGSGGASVSGQVTVFVK